MIKLDCPPSSMQATCVSPHESTRYGTCVHVGGKPILEGKGLTKGAKAAAPTSSSMRMRGSSALSSV